MKLMAFDFRGKTVRLLEPARKHAIRMAIISAVIMILFYILINIGFAEVAQQNSYALEMLSTELLNELEESNHGLIEVSRKQANMIQIYAGYLDQRKLTLALRLLYPACSYKKGFKSSLLALEKAATGEEAKKAIYQAGVRSNQLCIIGKKFSPSPIAWFKSEKLPEWLLTNLENAFEASHKSANELKHNLTKDNVIAACRNNRSSILLLSLAQLGYDDQAKIERFRNDVKQARNSTGQLAESTTQDKNKQEWLYEVVKSENRRVKILNIFLADNIDKTEKMHKICDLLREAIEKAFEKEKGNVTK